MRVFLGGSRFSGTLPIILKGELDKFIESGSTFLIGDAPGADTAFQAFLKSRNYKNIVIYSSADFVRNNLGDWKFEIIESGMKSKSSASHAFKDRHMSEICSLGIMNWDEQSVGTLSNVIDLIEQKKECHLYLDSEKQVVPMSSISQLNSLAVKYPGAFEEAQLRLARYRKRKAKLSNSLDFGISLFD